MSEQLMPTTYESVLELIRENAREAKERNAEWEKQNAEWNRRFQEIVEKTDKQIEKTDKQIEATNKTVEATNKTVEATNKTVEATTKAVDTLHKTVGTISDRVGNIVENLVGDGNLIDQFRELGHNIKTYSRKRIFGKRGTPESGEIDLFMEDGDVAILVEAKTTLKMDDVVDHIERIEKYRRFVDADGHNGKRFIGAVAGTVITENVINFAHENGLYVIIQSARAVEILAQPIGFIAKKW